MEVIIDGIKFVPESDHIIVHGIEYENVAHWLYNIRTILVNEWFNLLEDGQKPNSTPEQIALDEKRQRFDMFVEEYLGFVWDRNRICYTEKDK